MKMFIFRLFAVLVLLCGALAPGQGIMAQDNIQRHQGGNATVARFDGAQGAMMEQNERTASPVVRMVESSHRVGANRPSRVLPTHGGGNRVGERLPYSTTILVTLLNMLASSCIVAWHGPLLKGGLLAIILS